MVKASCGSNASCGTRVFYDTKLFYDIIVVNSYTKFSKLQNSI